MMRIFLRDLVRESVDNLWLWFTDQKIDDLEDELNSDVDLSDCRNLRIQLDAQKKKRTEITWRITVRYVRNHPRMVVTH